MFSYPNFRHQTLNERTFSIEAIHKINLPLNMLCTVCESVQFQASQDGCEVCQSDREQCVVTQTFSWFFPIFDMDKFRKICRHHSKECLKISKIAKFERDLLKTNEDTPPQSCKFLQTFVWWGTSLCLPPHKPL